LAIQLNRDLKPILEAQNIKLILVSIGKPERGLEFCDRTGFPPELLLADPENSTYDALGFIRGVKQTFFDSNTPKSIWKRIQTGNLDDIKNVMKVWTKQQLWIPPKPEQAMQQGGVVIFQGKHLVFSHYDPSTGSHVDMEVLKNAALYI